MFGIFSYVKIAVVVIMIASIAGAGTYVLKLRGDNSALKLNNQKLEIVVDNQKTALEQQKIDFASIRAAVAQHEIANKKLKEEVTALEKKFNKINASGEKRDLGALAKERPALIERIINRASINVLRCLEVSMGAPLTEAERNATKKSEINPECTGLVNPSFIDY